MNWNTDGITAFTTRALDILFLNNPLATSMGVLLGFILDGFMPHMSLIHADLSSIALYHWICLSVFVLNLKTLIIRPKLPENLETAFAAIEEARKRGINDIEIKQRYRLLIQKYVDDAVTNNQLRSELERLKNRLGEE